MASHSATMQPRTRAPAPWTPELHEIYPAGQWECVSIMSGNKSDGHGGAYRAWVHEVYKARLHMSKYQESSVVTRF